MPVCAECQPPYDPSRPMRSAVTISDGRSIAMPPYSSGIAIAVRPSSTDFRSTLIATPGFFSRIAGRFGSTSLAQNSSTMRPMARCSSLRSSGVKMSCGVDSSIRKAVPLVVLREMSVNVVMKRSYAAF